jgi:predicted methyltransferase
MRPNLGQSWGAADHTLPPPPWQSKPMPARVVESAPKKISLAILKPECSMIRYPFVRAAVFAATVLLGSTIAGAAAVPANIAAAVADSNRPDADKTRDANRKPAETLTFAGIKPGAQVAELLPGGGYFTRLFSKAVGSSGHVYAVVPAPFADAPADAPDFAARVKAIAADPNYANVSVVVEPFSQLGVPAPVDLVFTAQNYHDLHNFPGLDVGVFNKMVFDDLKPGGIYLIIDHAAEAGSGGRDTKALHRIDPKTVKAEVTAAGFVFVGGSEVLHQAGDDHTLKVFDPAIRGKTDQFILKFRKPKN